MNKSCTHVVAGLFPISITERGSWRAWGRSELSRRIVEDCVDFHLAALYAIEKITFGRWSPQVKLTPVEDSFIYRVGGHHTG